jgi:hypothetical protein
LRRVITTGLITVDDLRAVATIGYVVMPSAGSDAAIEQVARRLAEMLADDARRRTADVAPLERWCTAERSRPLDLRTAGARELRGAVLGIRLRGESPRLGRVVRDGVR